MPETAADPLSNPEPVASKPSTPLAALDTGYLQRVLKEMLHFIPGDPTAFSHVTNILRTLVAAELADPARIERDVAFAKEAAATAEALAADAEAQRAADVAKNAPVNPAGVPGAPVAATG